LNRRIRALTAIGLFALLAFGLGVQLHSLSEISYAQTDNSLIIPASQIPVTLDGRWHPQSEYQDAREVNLYLYPSTSGEFGRLEFKYDADWTYVYVDFTADTKQENTKSWSFQFDTMNAVYERPNTPGVYTLNLQIASGSITVSTAPDEPGIPLSSEDYRFMYSFGPSPNSPEPHSNLEVQFSTKRIAEHVGTNNPDRTMGFRCYLMDSELQLYRYPSLAHIWGKVSYSPTPTLDTAIAMAGGVLVMAVVAALVLMRRKSAERKEPNCNHPACQACFFRV